MSAGLPQRLRRVRPRADPRGPEQAAVRRRGAPKRPPRPLSSPPHAARAALRRALCPTPASARPRLCPRAPLAQPKQIWVIGAQNAGKSSLINALSAFYYGAPPPLGKVASRPAGHLARFRRAHARARKQPDASSPPRRREGQGESWARGFAPPGNDARPRAAGGAAPREADRDRHAGPAAAAPDHPAAHGRRGAHGAPAPAAPPADVPPRRRVHRQRRRARADRRAGGLPDDHLPHGACAVEWVARSAHVRLSRRLAATAPALARSRHCGAYWLSG